MSNIIEYVSYRRSVINMQLPNVRNTRFDFFIVINGNAFVVLLLKSLKC